MTTISASQLMDVIVGWVFLLAAICFVVSLAALKRHVEPSKRRALADVQAPLSNIVPPRSFLTPAGLKMYRLATIALIVSVVAATISIWKQMAQR